MDAVTLAKQNDILVNANKFHCIKHISGYYSFQSNLFEAWQMVVMVD